jgi:prepilin peptidase CpaA
MDLVKMMACVILGILAFSDLRSRRLPNVWIAAFAILYLLEAALNGSTLRAFSAHAALGAFSLTLAAMLFQLRWLGGGDVKMGAAVFLWCGPTYSVPLLLIISVSGALLGLSMFVLGWVLRHPICSRLAPRTTWVSSARGVPYGVALALGGAIAVVLQPEARLAAIAALLTPSFGHHFGLALIGDARFT